MPLRQSWTVTEETFSESGEGAQTTHDVYEANFGPSGEAQTGDISYPCDICGIPYPESKLVPFRGKVYGIPCGDSAYVQSILGKEKADSYRPSVQKPEREGGIIS